MSKKLKKAADGQLMLESTYDVQDIPVLTFNSEEDFKHALGVDTAVDTQDAFADAAAKPEVKNEKL